MIAKLREMVAIQCRDGNWNYDPYMHGMANGMIYCLAMFEGVEPKFLDAPKVWLKDLPPPRWSESHPSAAKPGDAGEGDGT